MLTTAQTRNTTDLRLSFQWTNFSYDPLGRETEVVHPDLSTATKVYTPGLLKVTDERGNIKRRHLDAYGRLEEVEEVNGTETYSTLYEYDATNLLVKVTNDAGDPTEITYDDLGRKISMNDPNMGSWSYTYDKRGNLLTQTDAKTPPTTINFTYDAVVQGDVATFIAFHSGSESCCKRSASRLPRRTSRYTDFGRTSNGGTS